MPEILEIDRNLLYVESKGWECRLKSGQHLSLGVVLEAVDLGSGNYPFIVEACLFPAPEYLHSDLLQEAEDEGACTRGELIRYIYENYGGVPVNIDAVQPAKASCGFSSFVANSSIGSWQDSAGTDLEVRRFENLDEAMTFAREFYSPYASLLFMFINAILDRPLRTGISGWDKLSNLAQG